MAPATPLESALTKTPGGGGCLRLFRAFVSPCLCGKSHVLSSLQPLLPLFALFSALPSFVFNRLQPLFPKHPGGGIPTLPLRASRPRHMRHAAPLSPASPDYGYVPSSRGCTPYALLCLCGKPNLARPLFSYSYELLLPQPLSFHIDLRCPGGDPLRPPAACAQAAPRPRMTAYESC
jgi:hypothetical protein